MIGLTNIKENVKWGDILNKPDTYAPNTHTHPWEQITGVPSTYTPSAHGHYWSDIVNPPSTYTPTVHTHDERYYTEAEINNIRVRQGSFLQVSVPAGRRY